MQQIAALPPRCERGESLCKSGVCSKQLGQFFRIFQRRIRAGIRFPPGVFKRYGFLNVGRNRLFQCGNGLRIRETHVAGKTLLRKFDPSHVIRIDVLTSTQGKLPCFTFNLEAVFLIQMDGGGIVGENRQFQPVNP